ncbi:hypothetical protein CRE_08365 [Caenorhabditis remanei]|uniref:Uncharacterized protein n=1 Tax=Caenorhabditis remanei TaxID=31234 RepID=E3MPD0_CAERE|nr:hypothetical protein CRE_08365 [Caenorhabditis remanei]
MISIFIPALFCLYASISPANCRRPWVVYCRLKCLLWNKRRGRTTEVIERKLGQTVYNVRVGSQRWTKHANQLRQLNEDFLEIEDPAEEMPSFVKADATIIPVPSSRTSIPPTTPVPLRRYTRNIKPVQPFQIQSRQKRY